MKYTGQFRDINNRLFTVDMITDNNETPIQLIKFGDNPFLSEMENGDDIFKPVKYQAATIRLFTDNVLFNIYSSKAKGTKITLKDYTNKVRWIGYIQPNMYNQDFNYDKEYLDIDAIDGLSILQYIDYSSADKKFINFSQLINNILLQCDCYSYFYLPASIQENETKNENLFRQLSISNNNFFDEDGEAWKSNEVLEEVCKFMGVTAVAQGDAVFFIDYEALKGTPKYYKTQIVDGDVDNGVLTDISDNILVNKNLFSRNKTQVSLGNTYNKIKVKDSLYSVDDLMPKLDDKKLLKNKNADEWKEYRQIPYTPNHTYYDAYYKFYDHPNFFCYHYMENAYADDKWSTEWDAEVVKYDDLDKYIGGNIIKYFEQKAENNEHNRIPSLDWQTYLYMDMRNSQHVPQQTPPLPTNVIRKFMTINIDKEIALNNQYTFLILDGSVSFCTKGLHAICSGEEADGNDSFDKENLYIEAILEYGGKYFSNANEDAPSIWGGEWVDEETTFKIYLDCNDDETDSLFNKNWDFKSNIDYTMGITCTSGYAIQLPSYPVVTTPPKLTFIGVRQEILNHPNSVKRPITGFWIGNLQMNIEIAYTTSDDKDEEDSDTSYENVINEDYVNDFEDAEFKICSWDDKEANYSAVVYDNGNERKYLDKIYHKVTHDNGRAEENFIKRYIRQYSNPPLILDMSSYNNFNSYTLAHVDFFNTPKTFIVDKLRIDWKNNTTEVKLNEIK